MKRSELVKKVSDMQQAANTLVVATAVMNQGLASSVEALSRNYENPLEEAVYAGSNLIELQHTISTFVDALESFMDAAKPIMEGK